LVKFKNNKKGIHTGNVVATILESYVPQHEVLGVHVKQAYHLENNCPENNINVSERTYSNVNGIFEFKQHEFNLNQSLKIKSHLLVSKLKK
jgi:class 3 adenylate cyclase